MKKSKIYLLLILLIGITMLVSCSSDDDTGGSSVGDLSSDSNGNKTTSCLFNYGVTGQTCLKIYEFQENGCSGGSQLVESCPDNSGRICFMISSINGIEYDLDFFAYGNTFGSMSCEQWVNTLTNDGIPSRLR